MSKKGITPREAVCQYMGWYFEEARDYRYHYGRTRCPVYSTPTGYICSVSNGKKPPKDDGFTWVEATGQSADFLRGRGQTVYLSVD